MAALGEARRGEHAAGRHGHWLAVVDDRTFTVTRNIPTPLVVEGFAKPRSSCSREQMREADAANDPARAVTANIGSGPFRFVASDYVSGSRLRSTNATPTTCRATNRPAALPAASG